VAFGWYASCQHTPISMLEEGGAYRDQKKRNRGRFRHGENTCVFQSACKQVMISKQRVNMLKCQQQFVLSGISWHISHKSFHIVELTRSHGTRPLCFALIIGRRWVLPKYHVETAPAVTL